MFNTATVRRSSVATQEHILSTALVILRERGLEAATMRDIAKKADVALGAAYYYFPSKEAIVQSYYDSVVAAHDEHVTAALADPNLDLEARLGIVFHTKFQILHGDRKLLGALFRYTGEPGHPLSAFGPVTRSNRQKTIHLFRLALVKESLPEDLDESLPLFLWAIHMLFLLYFIYDNSPQQQRTHNLINATVSLFSRSLFLLKLPPVKPFRSAVFSLLRDAGLFAEPSSPGFDLLQADPNRSVIPKEDPS